MDNFWHRLMSKPHSFRLTIHTLKSTLKKKKKKFSLQVIFYIVWNFVMKIPSHHASSHYRQDDKFVCFFFSHGEIFTACQIELFPFCTPIMILYCTYQMPLPCHNTMTQRQFLSIDQFRSRRTDYREDLFFCHHWFLFLFCEKKCLWKEKKKIANWLPT